MVDTNDFSVRDFAVNMSLDLEPGICIPETNAVWTVLPGTPASGHLSDVAGLSARFVNPKVGGVYRFSVTYAGSPATECNLVLPLAGASVDGVVAADLVAASNIVARLDATTGDLRRQMPTFGRRWFVNNGMGDYLGRVDNTATPTVWRYNQVNDESGMGAVATWHGLPIRMAKISNFMVGYATTRLGVWRVSQSLSQHIGTGNDASAQMSWDAGVSVANGGDYNAVSASMVTNAWHVSDMKEKRLWPNPTPTDNHTHSTIIKNYNFNFISPGFIERGYSP